jgi:hypothetical protein
MINIDYYSIFSNWVEIKSRKPNFMDWILILYEHVYFYFAIHPNISSPKTEHANMHNNQADICILYDLVIYKPKFQTHFFILSLWDSCQDTKILFYFIIC